MKSFVCVSIFLISLQWSFSQEAVGKQVDSLYKEDQFYIGTSYNLLSKKPTDLSQSGFSIGLHLGFIKDMPINKDRNIAIGIGLGYSANSFNQNLLINKDSQGVLNYSILSSTDTYSRNKFSEHLIEMPFEFRWRTSNATDYKFWRIYTGFKIGYVLASTTKHVGDLGNLKYKGIQDFNNLQYGLTLSIGYNTWNFYTYYGLNPMFSGNAKIDGKSIDMKAVKIGLMFYIL
ncbi:porin family protein [Yeosuana marina]|uniref:porin family protein n=1 Tax=Yeosuana marina TaxID=1565536 RepID=UPI0030EE1945|tara:strand:- start:340 stop:1032 length:693 start_codon:yes stop_codon:yes gene_type:complete